MSTATILSIQQPVDVSEGVREYFCVDSTFRKWWDAAMLFCILFQISVVPILLSDVFNEPFVIKHTPSLVLSYIFDMAVVVDVIFRSRFFSYSENGVTWHDPSHILTHYMKTENVWIEAMVVFPFDLIALAVGGKFIPFLRLSKVLRFAKLTHYTSEVERHAGVKLSFETRRMITMFFALFQVGRTRRISNETNTCWLFSLYFPTNVSTGLLFCAAFALERMSLSVRG
jgi:hypothetical protein